MSYVTNSRKSVYSHVSIDRGCGIIERLEKYQKLSQEDGGWNIREGWKKAKILIAKGSAGF